MNSRIADRVSSFVEIMSVSPLSVAALCGLWITFDILAGHKQHIWIMNLVWPITALYAGSIAIFAYYKVGRLSTYRAMIAAKEHGDEPLRKKKPFWQMVALGASHCGSGCTLADIRGEWALFAFPLPVFGMKIFGARVVDYFLTLLLGIFFQYFSTAPMRGLSISEGMEEAAKADPLLWFMMRSQCSSVFSRATRSTGGRCARASRRRCEY